MSPAPHPNGGNGSTPVFDGVRIFAGIPCGALLSEDHDLLVARPEETLFDAVNRMWWSRVGALPVLEGSDLVGRLSEDDLLRASAERVIDAPSTGSEDATPLHLWTDVLKGASVADVMTPRKDLAVVARPSSLLSGLEEVCSHTPHGSHARYLFVLADEPGHTGEVAGIVSFRDVARFLTSLYDGSAPEAAFPKAGARDEAARATRALLDLPLGPLCDDHELGHEPVVVSPQLDAVDSVRAMWRGRRGYVVTTFPDGAPMGICTRRDVLGAFAQPHIELRRTSLAALSTGNVHTASTDSTLCGLFKLMALEEFRHMPLVDDWDRMLCMISLWEAVSLVAGFGTTGGA